MGHVIEDGVYYEGDKETPVKEDGIDKRENKGKAIDERAGLRARKGGDRSKTGSHIQAEGERKKEAIMAGKQKNEETGS